ncbi:MAG: hypothetical protein H6807_10535 [Planctomycetes bacterium]|nr:hypothetical protein [Planctomycetota bacterium]
MKDEDKAALATYVNRLNGKAWGIALGMLCGFGLLFATIFLVAKGGEDVGQHLGLLCNYFPGYSVTYGGAFIGFAYAFVVGFAIGRSICLFYNLAARNS